MLSNGVYTKLSRIIGVFILYAFCSFLFAADLLYTKSAYMSDDGRVNVSFGMFRYAYEKTFNVILIEEITNANVVNHTTNEDYSSSHATYELYEMPITAQIGISRFLQFDFTLPLVAFRNLGRERLAEDLNTTETTFFGPSLGDVNFDIRIRWDKIKTSSTFNFGFTVVLPTGAKKSRYESGEYNETTYIIETNYSGTDIETKYLSEYDYFYEPISSDLFELHWDFYYTQHWWRDLLSHFNISYIYQAEEGETFWEIEPVFERKEKDGRADFQFYGAGLDDLFRKLFWINSREDPWRFSRNDRIETSLALEYYFDSPLTIGKYQLDIGYKIFAELGAKIAFSEYSTFNSEITLTPGVWLKISKFARFVAGYTFVLLDEDRRFYNKRLAISIRLMI